MKRIILAALVLAAACGTKPTNEAAVTIESAKFDPSLNVNISGSVKTSTGLYYRDLVVGTGDTAQAGKQVDVNYAGWLIDGKEFDATHAGEPPFSFQLGAHRVIDGWDEGVAGMRVGGKRQLIIPPALGYGAPGSGRIPPNSILVFVVELLGTH